MNKSLGLKGKLTPELLRTITTQRMMVAAFVQQRKVPPAVGPNTGGSRQLSRVARRGQDVTVAMSLEFRALVERALPLRLGITVLALLLADEAGWFAMQWLTRNAGVNAKRIERAYKTSICTLYQKIDRGEILTLADLRFRVPQVMSKAGFKQTWLTQTQDNPKLGHGRNTNKDGQPPLFVANTAITMMSEGIEPKADEPAVAQELQQVLDELQAKLSPLSLAVYDAVQQHRLKVGKHGSYRAVAKRLTFDDAGEVVGVKPSCKRCDEVEPDEEHVKLVRCSYLATRAYFAEKLAEKGYLIPEDRKRKRQKKS